jgi:histidyl-tRNA synthetase
MKKQKNRGLFYSPKGMHDIMPVDQAWWEKIRREVKNIAEAYNFSRIDTALLESASLFEKSLGTTSDVVEKQMFAFKTKGGDNIVLRPEGTAPIARAYIEHALSQYGSPTKLYYLGPMFRYEQPQAGRFRQFYQAGFEILGGDEDAIYDAQIILACFRLFEALKIKKVMVHINTIGCRNCRPNYKKKLVDYYKEKISSSKARVICEDCERRLAQNPLRLLDCKNPLCQELKKDAPVILNSLCSYCKSHFKEVLEYIEELRIPYALDQYLVRGLDYYNRTVFEFFTDSPVGRAAKNNSGSDLSTIALGGGGRYDYLVEMLGGRETPAVGGAVGLERIIEVIKASGQEPPLKTKAKVFLIHIGDLAKKKSLAILEQLRAEGVDASESLGKESLRAQLKGADRSGAPFALIFGQKEALEESIIIRDLQTGAQETVMLKKVASEVKRRLK